LGVTYHAELVGEEGVDLGQQVEQRSVGHRQGGSAPGPEGSGTLARVSNLGGGEGRRRPWRRAGGGVGLGTVFPPPLFCWRAPWSSECGSHRRREADGAQLTRLERAEPARAE
jgi:hypothetical protein